MGSEETGQTRVDGAEASPDGDRRLSRQVGERLRAIRRARGLSLAQVEVDSKGQWSASAVGAYERGFRNLSVPRLKAIADYFGVPPAVLLGEPATIGQGGDAGLVFDLARLRESMPGSAVERFTDAIARARGDFNGRVLSIRGDDLRAVCAMTGEDPSTAIQSLRQAGVLVGSDGPGGGEGAE